MSSPAPFSLEQLSIGEQARVCSLRLNPEQSQRLLEMGLLPGTTIEIVRFAPMGDPIDLKIRGYHLSIRKEDAKGILVERL
jgi:Fe2+ transport system protein FeoA